MLTKAQGFDKWAHLAGSAAGMLICLGVMKIFLPDWFVFTIGMWISSAIVFGAGLGLEIRQGRHPLSDGFSFLDLVADIAGILLVWGVIV